MPDSPENRNFEEDAAIRAYKVRLRLMQKLKALPFQILIAAFIFVILGMTVTVFLSAFSDRWFTTLFPHHFTMKWMRSAWKDYEVLAFYKITIEITVASTIISLLLSIPGAYVMARRNFPFKSTLLSFYQLPFMLPEIAYAIPIASIFYKIGLAETIPGLIIVQLLIGIPFSLFILIPFVESLDPRLEVAAQTLGANKFKMFTRIIVPQLIPGITAAAINIFIRMFSTFLIILLISGPKTQTLPVMVFSVLSSAGNQPPERVNALTLSLMFPLLVFTFLSLWVSAYTKRKIGK